MKTFNQYTPDFRDIVSKMEQALETEWEERAIELCQDDLTGDYEMDKDRLKAIEEVLKAEAVNVMLTNESNWSGSGALVKNFEEALKRETAKSIIRSRSSMIMYRAYKTVQK